MSAFYVFPFVCPHLFIHSLILVLVTNMVSLGLLTVEVCLTERACVLWFSTDMIISCLIPMYLHIAYLAYMSLYYLGSLIGVIFYNMCNQNVFTFKLLATRIALVFISTMFGVHVIYK